MFYIAWSKMKKRHWSSFLQHLGLFLLVEIIFVFIIFRELPPISLVGLTWILHSSYWIVILSAGWIREHYAHRVWQKFLSTYLPIVYHVIIHIYIGVESFHELQNGHAEQSVMWLIIWVVAAGILIALGEYRLHRTSHCATHHKKTHLHCHDEECIDNHKSI